MIQKKKPIWRVLQLYLLCQMDHNLRLTKKERMVIVGDSFLKRAEGLGLTGPAPEGQSTASLGPSYRISPGVC